MKKLFCILFFFLPVVVCAQQNRVNSFPLDYADSLKASVMKFNGTNWVGVGTADFARTLGSYISLAFPPSGGQPYLAFPDYGNFNMYENRL